MKIPKVSLQLLMILSCASLEIPERSGSDDESTLLALPFTFESTAQHGGPMGFHFIYDIASVDGGGIRQNVVFKQRLKGDVLLVDNLPPGKYKIAQLSFVPAGGGDHSYGNNKEPRNDRFTLEAGKITVLSRILSVKRYNPTIGRGMSTIYEDSIDNLLLAKRQEIIATLQGLPNFDQWKVQEWQ